MFRALSTRRDRRSYERLGDDACVGVLEAQLKRTTSMPAKFFESGKKLDPEQSFPANPPMKQAKEASKVHPFFSIFQTRRKKRATAKPEFARYVEYLKEGGIWDMNSNVPVIYYK